MPLSAENDVEIGGAGGGCLYAGSGTVDSLAEPSCSFLIRTECFRRRRPFQFFAGVGESIVDGIIYIPLSN